MRPDSSPVEVIINLPVLPDETVVEIQDFLCEILERFQTHYGHQIQRFYEAHAYNNLVHPEPNPSTTGPPF